MSTKNRVLLSLALLFLAAGPTLATMAPPLDVILVDGTQPAEAGEVYSDVFRLTAGADFVLESFEAPPNPCYELLSFDAPPVWDLNDGDSLDIPFSVLANDPTCGPLQLQFLLDGNVVTYSFDLAPESFAEGEFDQPLVQTGEAQSKEAWPGLSSLARPEPVPSSEFILPEGVAPHSHDNATKASRNIRVRGRIVYTRQNETIERGVDGTTVEVFDSIRSMVLTATDAQGYFDVTFWWTPCGFCGSPFNPNLYFKFSSENTEVSVRNGAVKRIRWVSSMVSNYGGSDLNMGVWTPAAEKHQPYLHALTVLTRCWRLVLNDTGLDASSVVCIYPNPDKSSGPFYWYAKKRIYMNEGRIWNEVTLAHEYGHHLVSNHAAGQGTDYCNGVCDNDGCGHCTWCVEQDIDAWNEGFPTFIGDSLRRRHLQIYGYQFLDTLAFEYLAYCPENGLLDDPTRNEGPFVALLADIEDANNEDDKLPGAGVEGFRDRLTLGTDEIWTVVLSDLPITPVQFLNSFRARFPQHNNDLWETAKNNGFETDFQAPPAPAAINSYSHVVGTPSTDTTVDLYWSTPLDDASGIQGYSIRASLDVPQAPTTNETTVLNVSTFTAPSLWPGNWYFSIRTLDRSGKWSSGYAWVGPIVIQAVQPPDLAPIALAGWAEPVVPRPAADVIFSSVPAPTSLVGETNSTYWNLAVNNHGSMKPTVDVNCALLLDGAGADYSIIPTFIPLEPGTSWPFLNFGPITVRGGRHSFGAFVENTELISETDEADNFWAKQWVWTPGMLPMNTRVERSAPPTRTGGWDFLAYPAENWNLDGVRTSANLGFHAAWAHALDPAHDYDLELHQPATGSETGFETWLGNSQYLAGSLDAVLWYHPLPTQANYDLGIVNWSGDLFPYAVKHIGSAIHPFGSSDVITIAHDDMMFIRSVAVSPSDVGPVSVTLQVEEGRQPFKVGWFDRGFVSGGLGSALQQGVTDADGYLRMDITVPQDGVYLVAVWRDPVDGADLMDLNLEIGTTKPDFTTVTLSGWYAPMVPSPAQDGTPGSVPAPSILVGDVASTWFNFALGNLSPTPAPESESLLLVDGAEATVQNWIPVPPWSGLPLNSDQPLVISAGRHTLSWQVDSQVATEEIFEDNNTYSEQWVWQPGELIPGNPVTRAMPAGRAAGWENFSAPQALWYNCDGLRTNTLPDGETAAGQWQAVIVTPGPSSDVDVRLHEQALDAKDGFAASLAFSGWGNRKTDYVLVNFNRTTARTLDAGVIGMNGSDPYTAELVLSEHLGINPGGTHGPFSLGSLHSLALHEMWLDPGIYIMRLINQDGVVDYGITLHPGNLAYLSKSVGMEGGTSYLAGPGMDEWITISVDTGRNYCLAVWKSNSQELFVNGTYMLDIQTGISDTPLPDTTGATRIARVWPNPFNPSLAVDFELASEQDATLAVYGLDGRLVRILVQDRFAAGRHHTRWDGTDAEGRKASSGVYFVQLNTGTGGRYLQRVTLLK